MSLRQITCGTLDKNVRGPLGVNVSDAPMEQPLLLGRESLDYWWQASVANPEGTMNEVLRGMNMVRDRKPFNRKVWTELAEIGQKVLARVSPYLRDGFLRAASHDRKRRIDALHVCHARMTIFRLLAQKDPAYALRIVARELGTLPYEDTFVRSDHALRKSFTPTADEWNLYGIYRLNLEVLYAELALKTNKRAGRDVLLWGIADAAHTAASKCLAHPNGNGSNEEPVIPSAAPLPEERNGDGRPQEQEDEEALITV